MDQAPVKLGPLALLLSVISICLATLAILTFTTGRADLALASKYANTVTIRYACERQAQEFYRDANEGAEFLEVMPGPDGTLTETFEESGSRLRVVLSPDAAGGYRVASWRADREWEQDDTIPNLWNGKFGE